MTIALLCPSRGRPEQLKRMIKSARDTVSDIQNIRIYVATNDQWTEAVCYTSFPENLPTAHKWNLLADMASRDEDVKLFMLASDDMIFDTPGWDKALLDHYDALDKKQHVYALQDSRDENGTPHPIVTREYIEAMGYFMPPWFLHWFIDSWTVAIAKSQNCFTHLKDYLLIHDKPSDVGKPDETHSRIREWGWHERDKYVDKTMRSAGLYAAEEMRFFSHIRKPEKQEF